MKFIFQYFRDRQSLLFIMLIMLIIPNLLIIGGIEFSKLPKTTKILVLLLLFLTIKNLEEN